MLAASTTHPAVSEHLARGRLLMNEHDSKRVLAECGLAVPKGVLLAPTAAGPGAVDPDQARTAILEAGLAGSLAVKFLSPEAPHKTDLGALRLGVAVDDVVAVCADMRDSAPLRNLPCDGYLVEEMAPSGVELMIGGLVDDTFGPIVMVGAGGILVELIDEVALRLCPIDRGEAHRMLRGLRVFQLLRGFRGATPADVDSVVDAVMAIAGEDGALMRLGDRIATIDINPLMVGAAGAMAVDAQLGLANGFTEVPGVPA